MQVSCISVKKIAWSATKTGIWLCALMFICGEVISPRAETWAVQKKTLALSRGQAIQTQFGTWVRNNNEFIHVGSIVNNDNLQNITRYNFDNKLELQSVMHADNAHKTDESWLLTNTKSTQFQPEQTTKAATTQTQITQLLDSEILQASVIKHLESLTLKNLWRLIKNRVGQELNVTEYKHAFWVKIFQPFAALVMIFLAVPFAFGPLRSSSIGLKLVIGIIIGFSFHTINSIFGPLTAIIAIPPILSASLPTLMFFGLGWWMVSKVP